MSNARSCQKCHPCLLIALAAIVLIAPPLTNEASADPAQLPKFGWSVNGSADAAAHIGNVLYVGGSFTRVVPLGTKPRPLYELSTITGEPLGGLPVVEGLEIRVVEPDGAGGYYIGGAFTRVGDQARSGLARIRADGTIDPVFLPAVGTTPGGRVSIGSITRADNRLFITGGFTTVEGAPRSGFAAIDASTGKLTPWVPAVTGWKTVFAAGHLVVIGYVGDPTLAWVGATALDAAFGGVVWQRLLGRDSTTPGGAFFSRINDIVAVGNRLIAGGRFGANTTGVGQTPCRGTVLWLDAATGVVDPTWTPSASDCGVVTDLAVSGDTLYVGGTFIRLGGQVRTNAAAIDLTTGAVTGWMPEPNGSVTALDVSSAGSVYLGGQFTAISGQSREGLAEIDASQTLTSWKANVFPHIVYDIQLTDHGSVIVASTPAVSGGTPRRNLAAFDMSTGAVLDWQPTTDQPVKVMAAGNNAVYVGGTFESVNGAPRHFLAAINPTTGSTLPWMADPADQLSANALVVHADHLYLGGSLPGLVHLRRLNRVTGKLDAAWAHRLDFTPGVMLAHEDRLYVGGVRNSPSTSALAAIDLASGQRLPWDPPVNGGHVFALARADQTLYVGGTFTSLADQPRSTLGAFDLRTGLLSPWAPEPDVVIEDLAVVDRVVVATGGFSTLAGQPRQALGAVTFSGAPASWSPSRRRPNALVAGPTDLALIGTPNGLVELVNDISIYALSGAPRPSNLTAAVAGTTVAMTWSAPLGITPMSYRIEAGSRPGASNLGTFVVGGTTTSLSGVAPAGTYFVRVRAVLSESEPATEPTNEVAFAVGCTAPPPPPTALYAQIAGAHVTLRWTASSPTARHVLEFGTTFRAADLATLPTAAGQEMFEADAPVGTYFARVRAANECGASSPSGEIMFTIGASVPLPDAPTGLSAVVNVGVLRLSWTGPPGPIIGYLIEAGSASGLADLAVLPIAPMSTLQVPGVPTGTYFVRVRAVTAAGVGPPSSDVVVVR